MARQPLTKPSAYTPDGTAVQTLVSEDDGATWL